MGPTHHIAFQPPQEKRNQVLGVAALRQSGRIRLYLARLFSVDWIEADNLEQANWGPTHKITGLSKNGRLLISAYIVLLCCTSLLLVGAGISLLRRRPPRLTTQPPFRLTTPETPAPLWLRGSAYMVDTLFILPLIWLLCDVMFQASPAEMVGLAGSRTLAFHLAWQAITIPYFLIGECFFATSAGKALFGLRIASADGCPLRLQSLLVRSLSRFIDSAFLVGLLPISITPLRQRFGDIWADTVVVLHQIEEEEEEDIDW